MIAGCKSGTQGFGASAVKPASLLAGRSEAERLDGGEHEARLAGQADDHASLSDGCDRVDDALTRNFFTVAAAGIKAQAIWPAGPRGFKAIVIAAPL